MANPITIKVDQATLAAGVSGSSRDDGVVSQVVTLADPANPGFVPGRLWELVAVEGAAVALSSNLVENPTFTPASGFEGTYLVYLSYGDGTKSWTDGANGERFSTQGGLGVKQANGTRLAGHGETTQFGAYGWGPAVYRALYPVDGQLPTVNEKAAIVGTSGAPSAANKFVTNSDARIPTANENNALAGTSGSPSAANKFVTDSDARVPTVNENDALVGTDGAPSAVNKYVTDSDPRLGAGGGGSGPLGQSVEVVSASAPSGVLGNGVEYVPLVQGAGGSVEFQFGAASTGAFEIVVLYAMSAANAGDVELTVDRLISADGLDPSSALVAGAPFVFTPGNDVLQHSIASADSAQLSIVLAAGDFVRCAITRPAGGGDTHTGDMRILQILVRAP